MRFRLLKTLKIGLQNPKLKAGYFSQWVLV